MRVAEELASVLTDGGKRNRLLHHVTRARHLPDILASGALLPAGERLADHMHGWGENRELGKHLVCTSLKPHWGIVKHQFDSEEAVILSFSPESVVALPGVLPCPMNSATREAKPYLLGDVDPVIAAQECVTGEAWRDAEILVPGSVPVSLIQLITFCDETCRTRWRPFLNATVASHQSALNPEMKVRVAKTGEPPRFPDDYRPVRRLPVEAGADQRQKFVTAVVAPSPIELDEVDWWDEEDDVPVDEEHGDLFEQLYGSTPIDRFSSEDEPED